MKRPGLIAIAGIIGVGKTTLAEKLAPILKADLILEEYAQNPFLARQVAGDREAALASELFFLLSRSRQLAPQTTKADYADRTEHSAICDYIFQKNRIFARMYLNSHQFAIFDEVERTVKRQIRYPQVVIYLTDRIETCLERIIRRRRDFEKTITAEWLERLSHAYEELFQNWQQGRLVRIDCSQYDLRQEVTVKEIAQHLQTILLQDGD